jgi:twitching motility protein PilT
MIQTGGAHGMQTMDASLASLVRAGRITEEMAITRSSSPEELRKLVEMPPSAAELGRAA